MCRLDIYTHICIQYCVNSKDLDNTRILILTAKVLGIEGSLEGR